MIFSLQVEEYNRELYKIVKVFTAKKKEMEKEMKARKRIKDSKDKDDPEIELAAITVAQTVQQQVREFKVGIFVVVVIFLLFCNCCAQDYSVLK